ncbi:MAG TPA: family 1 glycosylhydrolase [Jiangellales bacterium]|nr:family 1 glycosylhydrolase [Jiangellales bacterium]
MNPDFPANFLWGAATSAHQVEGGNTNNDWWDFEHDPGSAARQSSLDGIDHYHRYREDFALLRSLGHNAHRLSLEWSRIEPAPGEFSRSAIAHYRRVLTALADAELTAFVTLHHFTLPRWFSAYGGWLASEAITTFTRYCRHVADQLGDLMPFICTINEPQMVALHGYLEGYHPPGLTNPILWKRVSRVLLDAHHAAVAAIRESLSRGLIGLAVQLPLLAPIRDDDVTGALHQTMQHELVDLYLDGLTGPDRGDWLGVQYYRKQWVDPASPTLFAAPPADFRTTQMGWAVYPDGLRQLLHRAAKVGLPLYVTENGIATEDDGERIVYLQTHLAALAQAIREGADVRGYLHWSAFDNFEWSEGYHPKFGLIAINHHQDFTRIPKPSAHAFARIARTGQLDAPADEPAEARDERPHRSIGPLPEWDPQVLPLIQAWPEQPPGDQGIAALVASRRDRLPAEQAARGGDFHITEHSIPSRWQPSLSLTVLAPTRHPVRGAIYWLHSGGQVGGSALAPDIVPVLDIAERCSLVIVAAEYALAPELPAPAGLHDAYDGFVWTAQNATQLGYPPGTLFLHGLSGGGGLAAGTALLARDAGITYAGLVLDGPMLDNRFTTTSMRQHEASGLPMIRSLRLMWDAIIGTDASADHDFRYAVPGRLVDEDLSGLPAAYILCGANDPFRDETTAFAEAIWRSGGSADLHQWAGIGHGFDLLAPDAHVCRELSTSRQAWYDRMLNPVESGRAPDMEGQVERRFVESATETNR